MKKKINQVFGIYNYMSINKFKKWIIKTFSFWSLYLAHTIICYAMYYFTQFLEQNYHNQ